MKDFLALFGALLVNLVLFMGVLYLPPVGVQSLENIYVFVWLAFGLLINLGFLRQALRTGRRRSSQSSAGPKGQGEGKDSQERVLHRRRGQVA